MSRIRVAEVFAALSLTTDLASGVPFEKGLRTCVVATAFGGVLGLAEPDRLGLFHASLLRSIGCTAHAPENAAFRVRGRRARGEEGVGVRPGPLGSADWERVRLHGYWTDRILRRCPALTPLAELAAGHHERCDGSGYHRGVRATDLPFAARLLAAADVFAAATEPRPYRRAMSVDGARALLAAEATAGRLDPEACAAVVEGAGLPRPRRAWPDDLTDREVDVLRLAARGMSNRAIAAELVVSERTVGHHLAHIYDKTGRRTRAGAAVFAMEHDLLPAQVLPG